MVDRIFPGAGVNSFLRQNGILKGFGEGEVKTIDEVASVTNEEKSQLINPSTTVPVTTNDLLSSSGDALVDSTIDTSGTSSTSLPTSAEQPASESFCIRGTCQEKNDKTTAEFIRYVNSMRNPSNKNTVSSKYKNLVDFVLKNYADSSVQKSVTCFGIFCRHINDQRCAAFIGFVRTTFTMTSPFKLDKHVKPTVSSKYQALIDFVIKNYIKTESFSTCSKCQRVLSGSNGNKDTFKAGRIPRNTMDVISKAAETVKNTLTGADKSASEKNVVEGFCNEHWHGVAALKMQSDVDVNSKEEFDVTCILTFDKVYKEFINEDRVDVFDGMSRSEFRCKYSNIADKEIAIKKLLELKKKPKNIEENSLSCTIENPFDLLNFNEKTDVQQKIEKHSEWMKYYGNYAYSCSCGAGKTVAGIYLMYKKQCKTLIISSRNAINDQWKVIIEQLYPNLIIYTKDGYYTNGSKIPKRNTKCLEPDVYILSPQFLVTKLDMEFNPGLIIYDEIHSLLSKEFIKVLLMPMVNVIKGRWSELPYMIALSATYPSKSTWQGREANNRLNKIFGSIFLSTSTITNIPVKVWDYREHYERENREGEKLTGQEARGNFDSNYVPLDDIEAIEYFCEKINNEGVIKICPEYKGIIMTYTIDTSVYAALYVHKFWNCNVVLIRSSTEQCIFFEKDKYLDIEFDSMITFSSLNFGEKCDYKDVVDKCCIMVGTLQRLKEGFSIQNITWGICTKFIYNTIPRVQILGRIRRNSNNKDLNKQERIFYVCSGCVPNTIGIPNYRGKHKITYDFNSEKTLFKLENYIRI